MSMFSAMALDRLLEPGASSVAKKKDDDPAPRSRLERHNTTDDSKSSSSRLGVPPPYPQLRRRDSVASAEVPEKKPSPWPQISPALYTTPEPTPLPDSPTSFSPSSPYIINHKRRGPRLLKTFPERNVAAFVQERKEESDGETESKVVVGHSRSFSDEDVPIERKEQFEEEKINGHFSPNLKVRIDGLNNNVSTQEGNNDGSYVNSVEEDAEVRVVNGSNLDKDGEDTDDFFEPPESMSCASVTDGEDCCVDRSAKIYTLSGEFYDAWDELSSDSGRQLHRTPATIETELREMRLSLLMEIEKRKQAEEALNNIRSQWQLLREKLGAVGLILPAELPAAIEDCRSDVDPTEEICQQIHLTRFVSESIGRGIGKAEIEAEMEAQLEIKNFEIARLYDRLHYYETMNREMSHRNQEAIEVVRRQRQKRRRRQKWVWGSIVAVITIGGAALAWSYLASGRGASCSSTSLESSEIESDVR